MDSRRFDTLSRLVATRIGRRSMLTAALGLAIAPVAATEAVRRPGRCRRIGVGCSADGQCCDGVCATSRDLPRSLRNRCSCPADSHQVCDGRCVPIDLPTHCGSCGNTCRENFICEDGQCVCPFYQCGTACYIQSLSIKDGDAHIAC